jgi:hypothetical protein
MTETPPAAATAAAVASAPASTFARVWTGYLSGTNRGRVRAALTRTGEQLTARAIFEDAVFGVSMLTLAGTMRERHAALRILEARGVAQGAPLDGYLLLEFAEDLASATGAWSSDIGTQGQCVLRATRWPRARWWVHAAWAHLTVSTRRALPVLYPLGVLVLIGITVRRGGDLTVPVVILLLVLAPLLMRDHIKDLLVLFGVKKLGPAGIEFHEEQKPLPMDLRPAAPPALEPPTATAPLAAPTPADEEATFRRLHEYLAPRTKLMLQLLVWEHKSSWEQFRANAEAIGVPADNVDATRGALLQSGAAAVVDGQIVPTRFARRYLDYLAQLSAPGI